MGEDRRGKSSGEMARSGSSNKVGSGRNKGKMAPQDGKDLKGESASVASIYAHMPVRTAEI